MMRLILSLVIFFLLPFLLNAQQEEKKELPKLDIPEITIVGKKAITLPFAKKGEYTSIDYISAPKLDTSIIGNKQILLGYGSSYFKRSNFVEKLSGYFEAGVGNYSRFNLLGLVRFSNGTWEGSLRTGYNSTSGHVKNADGNRFNIGADFGTMIYTDNEYLKSFRMVNIAEFITDKFGIYGFKDSTIRRSRQLFSFKTNLFSSEFKSISINFLLGLNSLKIEDNNKYASSTFAPDFKISSSFNLFKINFLSKLSYEGSTLNFSIPVESPSLFQFSLIGRKYLNQNIYTTLGMKYVNGTNSDGGSQYFLYPSGSITVALNSTFKFSIWFEPDVLNNSYISHMLNNPFLDRELVLRYSFKPIHLGIGVDYSYRFILLSMKFSYAKFDDAFYPDVKNGFITSGYADVDEYKIEINNIVEIDKSLKLYSNAIFDNLIMQSSKKQLLMTPIFQWQNRFEYSHNFPFKLFLDADFISKRRVNDNQNLPAYLLFGVGINSNVIKKTLMTLEINNLFNTRYDYFVDYTAPGVTFLAKIQYNF